MIEKDGKKYKRVEECSMLFESGSMPVAQQHFRLRTEVFEESFGRFYPRGLDQTRLWFYVLHVLKSIALANPPTGTCGERHGDGGRWAEALEAAAEYPPVEEVLRRGRTRCGFTCWQ